MKIIAIVYYLDCPVTTSKYIILKYMVIVKLLTCK